MCRSGGFGIIARSVRMLVDGKCSGIESVKLMKNVEVFK